MARRFHDRALRREMRRLARIDPEDLRLILDTLPPDRRQRALDLLRARLRGERSMASDPTRSQPPSPWLMDRLTGMHDVLTPATLGALAGEVEIRRMAMPRSERDTRPRLLDRGLAALSSMRTTR